MISTWLSIELTENSVPLSRLDLSILLKVVELPPNEGVVVWVSLGGEEGPSPVSVDTESQKGLKALWWEEVQPVVRVNEFGDLFLRDVELLKDLVLGEWHLWWILLGFFGGGDLLFCWLITVDLTGLEFFSESVGGGLDWHTGAMEGEWEHGILAELLLESHHEFRL